MKTHLMTVVAVTVVLAGCTQSAAEPEAQGAALLAPFKQDLKSALVKGMESGPVAAISACRTEAPMIAGRLAVDGVVMGRSSHKLRNPENVAPEWVAPLLVDYAAARLAGPVAIETTKGRFGYVEPIMIQPMCLNCHGSALHPDVEARIDELYPVDDAKGFSEGDFRGVFWVEFPQS